MCAQEFYRNDIYNQNQTGEVCSDIVVNENSYIVFSASFIYDEENINIGSLILLREFDFLGNIINSDSLEVFGCTAYPFYSDNVIKTDDGGYVLAWHACLGRLFKFNTYLELEWEAEYPDLYALLTVSTTSNGYLLSGQIDNNGQKDIWLGFVDTLGNINNEIIYGDEEKLDKAFWIEPTTDGGYLLSGGRYHTWNPLLVKIDSLGNVQWEQTYGNNYEHAWGIARSVTDSTYILAYENSISDDFSEQFPPRELRLLLLDSIGDVIEIIHTSEPGKGLYVYDLEIVGEDIYCLYQQFNEPQLAQPYIWESRLLKYNMNTGVVWERAYRGFSTNQDELSLMDLELIENPENEIEFLMAGFLYDYSLTGSLLQCTWVLGADCQGYSSTPELSIQTQVSDVQNPGEILFENTGTQLDTLNWWFSTGEISNLQSPELTFENNGAYQVELNAPYCGRNY